MKLYITHFRRLYSNKSDLDIVDSEAFFIDRHVYFSYETGKNYIYCYIVSKTPVHFLGSSDFRRNYSKRMIEIDYKRGNTALPLEQFFGVSGLHNYSYGGENFNLYFPFTEELAKTIREGLHRAHRELLI